MARLRPLLKFDVVTLFPGMFDGPMSESLLGKAQEAGVLQIKIHNLRDWSVNRHRKVDDRPYGGGAGMVIEAEPVYQAIKSLGGLKKTRSKPWVIYLSPQGPVLKQSIAERLVKKKHVILICGHYEGIDERLMDFVDQELSIGDYVLTGGELPAMVVMDTMARFVPGVVGDPESVVNDSFSTEALDYPHYTRPAVWRGKKVPAVLMSGNHRDIAHWRKQEALKQTARKRPDLKLTSL